MRLKTFLIMGGVALVFFLLVVRFFFSEFGQHEKEHAWFARNLRYEFSAAVDTVTMFNKTTGRIHARITDGNPLTYREDSLTNSLKKNEKIEFIFKHHHDSITFVLQNANQVQRNDSIRISSQQNTITVYRSGTEVSTTCLSEAMIGWGKPPVGN